MREISNKGDVKAEKPLMHQKLSNSKTQFSGASDEKPRDNSEHKSNVSGLMVSTSNNTNTEVKLECIASLDLDNAAQDDLKTSKRLDLNTDGMCSMNNSEVPNLNHIAQSHSSCLEQPTLNTTEALDCDAHERLSYTSNLHTHATDVVEHGSPHDNSTSNYEPDGRTSAYYVPLHSPLSKADIVFSPCRLGTLIQGHVYIHSGLFNSYTYVNSQYPTKLLKATRSCCGFNIYNCIDGVKKYIGFMKCNLLGTKFEIFNMKIEYKWGLFTPRRPRSFSVIRDNNVLMVNKEPYYDSESKSYSLNFNGRITTPSVKNFQLVHPLDLSVITLTFGKISDECYVLDHGHPWTGVQAFSVALAALTHKIGCD